MFYYWWRKTWSVSFDFVRRPLVVQLSGFAVHFQQLQPPPVIILCNTFQFHQEACFIIFFFTVLSDPYPWPSYLLLLTLFPLTRVLATPMCDWLALLIGIKANFLSVYKDSCKTSLDRSFKLWPSHHRPAFCVKTSCNLAYLHGCHFRLKAVWQSRWQNENTFLWRKALWLYLFVVWLTPSQDL